MLKKMNALSENCPLNYIIRARLFPAAYSVLKTVLQVQESDESVTVTFQRGESTRTGVFSKSK